MNKYEKFTKIADLVIEMAELVKDEGFPETMQFKQGMRQFIPKEYNEVHMVLFPVEYAPPSPLFTPTPSPYSYGYGQPQQQKPWSSAWTPGSPVTQQRDIFDNLGAAKLRDDMFKGMGEEESDIEDATNFVNAIKQFLPTGHMKNDMGIMGEIVNAVREKDFVKAANIVKESWVEEGRPNIWRPTDINNEMRPTGVWGESDPHFDPYNPVESVDDELCDDDSEDITE